MNSKQHFYLWFDDLCVRPDVAAEKYCESVNYAPSSLGRDIKLNSQP